MEKYLYEELPEVLFQEEMLLRSIRQEFTTIVHDMKSAGHFDSLETVEGYGLSDAVKKLITEHALAVEATDADISGLKTALTLMPYHTGPLDTLEDMIAIAIVCVNTFSFILKTFGARMVDVTTSKIEVERAFSDEDNS